MCLLLALVATNTIVILCTRNRCLDRCKTRPTTSNPAFVFGPPTKGAAITPQRLAVLTRTGRRRESFARLRETLLRQRLGRHQVRHVLSNDNPECDFLPVDATVVPVAFKERRNNKHCPYDAYFGPMMRRVEADEWILHLDDEAKLVRDTYLAELLDHAALLDPTTHFRRPTQPV